MKSYKCIKKFPNGPKIGDIVNLIDRAGVYCLSTDKSSSVTIRNFFPSDVENYPEFWEEIKDEILFTTEDGVQMKKGNTYYPVDTTYFINLSPIEIINPYHYTPKNVLNFSTKEKAEEYIL